MKNLIQTKRNLRVLLIALFAIGFSALPIFGRSPHSRFPTARTWRPLPKVSTKIRRSVSFPTQPKPQNSFYPTIRNNNQAAQNNHPGTWTDLGGGSRMKLKSNSRIDSNSKQTIDPLMLEALNEIKAKNRKPLYQLATAEAAPITGATPNTLEQPSLGQDMRPQEADEKAGMLLLPTGKNPEIEELDFRQKPVADALSVLARTIEINLMLSPNIQGNVTIFFRNITMQEAFNTLLTSYNLSHRWSGSILSIYPAAEEKPETRIFQIQHTNATEIKPQIDRMLTQGGVGSCEVDARTNSLVVTDTITKLAEIKNLLPQIDIKQSSVEVSSRPLTEVFYLNYADASSLRPVIEMLSTGVQIQEFSSSQASQAGAAGGGGGGGGRMDMMIITDTQNNLNRIRELVEKLDVAPIQVTIDAHIYEIDKNEEEKVGVNWQKQIPLAGTDENLFSMTVAPETNNAGGTGVFRFGSLDVNQFQALLAMLKTQTFAKVLSNPVITTLNNRAANITVGQAIPYVSASQVNAETGQVTNTVAQANANITLQVTPSVTGNDEVFLDIAPTISSVLGFTELGGNSTPNLSNRTAQTQVICKNNHTIVIGGMIKTDKNETVTKVPFFGNLPGIGKLFQKKTFKEQRTELIIFITPHIVRSTTNKPLGFANQAKEFVSPRLTLQP